MSIILPSPWTAVEAMIKLDTVTREFEKESYQSMHAQREQMHKCVVWGVWEYTEKEQNIYIWNINKLRV